MKFRSFLCVIALSLPATLNAQDKIYKKNGELIEGKVKEVSQRGISYHKSDNPNGPIYNIGRNELTKIEYENGTKDFFSGDTPADLPKITKRGKVKKVNYGNNVIAASPLQVTEGIGVGISYERSLDKKSLICFYLPVMVAFSSTNVDPFATTPLPAGTPTTNPNETYFISPGIKFYPTSSKGVIRYAVGPSIVAVTGKRYVNELIYDNNNNIIDQFLGYRNRFTLGVIVNNTLNINPTPHLFVGLNLGLGFSYLDMTGGKKTNKVVSLSQFGFQAGYRF